MACSEEAKRLRADEDVKRAYEAIKDEGIDTRSII